MVDFYQLFAEIEQHKQLVAYFQSIDLHKEAETGIKEIQRLEDLYYKSCEEFLQFRGKDDEETLTNIYHATLERVTDDKELVQFVFEELDGASQGDKKAKDLVEKCGIDSSYFKNAIFSESSVDRADGPQQFLIYSIFTLFPDTKIALTHRLTLLNRFVNLVLEKNLLNILIFKKCLMTFIPTFYHHIRVIKLLQ
jgi:hypothetical protein